VYEANVRHASQWCEETYKMFIQEMVQIDQQEGML